MLKKVKVGKGKWVAGTRDRFSGLGSVDPVNRRQVSIPAYKRNTFTKKKLMKVPKIK